MCVYRELFFFNCGHEDIIIEFRQTPLCFFRSDSAICRRDLGVYRVVETTVNDWCFICKPIVESNPPVGVDAVLWPTPQVLPQELVTQKADREKLNTAAHIPESAPPPSRLNHINRLAHMGLAKLIKAIEDSTSPFTGEMCSWIIKYIASLAPWMDRRSLIETVRPWFAEALDEDYQICTLPNLKTVQCEYMLDDIMVWTKEVLV
ncbi:hypothetical protein M434DRAFT_15485 [Hypoxylon sp. CO27-5]|nr:hypothetical protein M434DRAFT_15485 [Hypoxylon sp. CO27-5]